MMRLFSSKKSSDGTVSAETSGLTLWGRANSVNVQKPLWLLAELGAEFDRIDAGGPFGRLDSAEFKALSPHGEIPVLVDRRGAREVVIWESAAIMRFLTEAARRDGDPQAAALWPEDLSARAAIDRWGEWAQVNFYPPVRDLFTGIVRAPRASRNLDSLKRSADEAHKIAARADATLEATGFLAGPSLSLADFPFAGMLHRYMTLEITRPELPSLVDYYERVKARPAYAKIVAVDYDTMRVDGAERLPDPIL